MSSKEMQLALKLMEEMKMYSKFDRALQTMKNDSPIFTAAKNVLAMPELAKDIDMVFIKGVLVLTEATAIVYADAFSKRDLKKLIKFYKSNIGKKFVDYSPYIEEKVMNASTNWMTKSIKEISDIVLSYTDKINDIRDKTESAIPVSTKLH
jgi:hypothetical protein